MPPTVLQCRIYYSYQTPIYLWPTQTCCYLADCYCKLLTSAKLCQETEVIENSREVEENASQITLGFFLFYLVHVPHLSRC